MTKKKKGWFEPLKEGYEDCPPENEKERYAAYGYLFALNMLDLITDNEFDLLLRLIGLSYDDVSELNF